MNFSGSSHCYFYLTFNNSVSTFNHYFITFVVELLALCFVFYSASQYVVYVVSVHYSLMSATTTYNNVESGLQ